MFKDEKNSSFNPIFLVGVPRSGTTLLRMILDLHPNIYSGPEMPWLGGNYGPPKTSIRALYERMKTDLGSPEFYLSGVPNDYLKEVFRKFIIDIIKKQLRHEDKNIWVEKTPDNIIQLPFLQELFPKSKVIHIIRDGRDVALSTINTGWKQLTYFVPINSMNKSNKIVNTKRKFPSVSFPFHFSMIKKPTVSMKLKSLARRKLPETPLLHPPTIESANIYDVFVESHLEINYFNALWRWREWIKKCERDLEHLNLSNIVVFYEKMIKNPKEEISRIINFLGQDWNDNLLRINNHPAQQILTKDTGMVSFQNFKVINPKNTCKWKKQLLKKEKKITRKYFDDFLIKYGYEVTS